jgi:hypothetical protein
MEGEEMTPEKAIEVRDFAINWIEKVHHRSRKATKAECRELLEDLIGNDFDEDSDAYDVLSWENWDYGNAGRYPCDFWTECRDYSFWGQLYTPRVIDLCETAFRVAMDMLIEQSGGVAGYTVGDLKKAFDGVIPDWINDRFEGDLNAAEGTEPVWL